MASEVLRIWLLGLFHPNDAPTPAVPPIAAVARLHTCTSSNLSLRALPTADTSATASWLVEGCGAPFIDTFVPSAEGWTLRVSDQEVRVRAPFDLACQDEPLTVRFVDADRRAVEGCGNQAQYHFDGTGAGWERVGAAPAEVRLLPS